MFLGIAYWMREVFKPLLYAALIAYLLYPLVHFLYTRIKIGRKLAANLVYFVTLTARIAFPATLIPVLTDELQTLVDGLLLLVDRIEALLARPFYVAGITFHLQASIPSFREAVTSFLTPLPQDAWRLIEATSTHTLWFLVILLARITS